MRKKLLLVGCTSKIARQFIAAAGEYELYGTCFSSQDAPEGLTHTYRLDLSKEQEVIDFLASVRDVAFDGVLAFASTYAADPETGDDFLRHFHETLQINVAGIMQIAQTVTYADNSSVVLFGDAGLDAPKPGFSIYSLSKAVLENATKILAIELQPKTRVLCFRLGPVAARSDHSDKLSYSNRNLLQVEDPVAGLVNMLLFCLGEQNLGMTGAIVDYDGGAYLRRNR